MSDRPLHIVLVEDDEIGTLNVQQAFAKGNIDHPMWVAQDGQAALDLLRSGEVPEARRLVLLDLHMPQMGGIEFLEELRADPRLCLTPVVVLTSSDDDRDLVETYRLNVSGYLVKPVTFAALVELIHTLASYWSAVEQPAPIAAPA